MRFQVGDVLSSAFSVTAKGFIPFFLIGLIVYIPLFLLVTVVVTAASPALFTLLALLGWVFSYVVAGAITYGVVQALKGNQISVSESLSVGFQRMFPVLLVSLVVGLCVMAGLLLLVVPGIILAIMLFVAVPAAVIEKPGVFGSIDRSMELTKGYRWQIFFIALIIMIGSAVLSTVITGGQGATMELDPDAGMMVIAQPSLGAHLLSMLMQMVVSLFSAVASSVVYYRLRQVKEDADIDDLASVFE